jgi:hypothetical protein
MAAARKWGLLELVLWDVILAAVAAVLVFVDSREAAEAGLRPAPSQPAPVQSPLPTSGGPDGGPVEAPRPTRKKVDPLKAEFERLADEAEGKSADEARRIYAKASRKLARSELWKRFMERESERLQGSERADARRLLFRVRLRATADLGASGRFASLAARTPPDLVDMERERSWAALRAKGSKGGLNLSGFSPDQTTHEGRRCRIESFVGSREGTEARNVVDATLATAEAVFGRQLPAIRVGILKEPAASSAKVDVATFARRGEPEAERLERIRLLTASWALERLHPGCLERWSGRALAEAAASLNFEAAGSRPTPLGRAARAVASESPPPGDGERLREILSRGEAASGKDDPTCSRLSRLATFALEEREGRATRLWTSLRAHAAAGKAFSKSIRSSRLEADWAAHERSP